MTIREDEDAARFKLSYPPPRKDLLLDVMVARRHEMLNIAEAEGKKFRLEFVSSSASGRFVRVRLVPEGNEAL